MEENDSPTKGSAFRAQGGFQQAYQLNQYWFVRGIDVYNGYLKNPRDDFLLSFTCIPGIVVYPGHGSLFQRTKWDQSSSVPADSHLETYQGIFFKLSYLWRS